MMERLAIFFIVAFCFALVLILKRDTIPDKLRRPLAITALFMVVIAFALMIYSFFI